MSVRPRGDSWQADFTFKGKRFRQDFSTKEEALAWEAAEKVSLYNGHAVVGSARDTRPDPQNATDSYTMEMLVAATIAARWAGTKNSKAAVINARDCATVAAEVVLGEGGKPSKLHPKRITEAVIDDMIQRWKHRGNSDGTINRKLSALNSLLKTAKRRGVIDAVPEIIWKKEPPGRERYLTVDEERQVIEWFEQKDDRPMQDLVILLLDTGMRLSEALSLTWRDIPVVRDGEAIRIWNKALKENKGTKNDSSRSAYQSIRVAAMLSERKASRPVEEQRVFWELDTPNQVDHRWDHMRRGLGFQDDKEFVVHSLRHTWASRMVSLGCDLYTLMNLGGWKTQSMVARYAHLFDAAKVKAARLIEGGFNPYKSISQPVTQHVTTVA